MKSVQQLFQDGSVWSGVPASGNKRVSPLCAPFCVEEIDTLLGGGLCFGALHEWSLDFFLSPTSKHSWTSPLLILSQLVGNACRAQRKREAFIAWVGTRCWPMPALLHKTCANSERHIFLNPETRTQRLWTTTHLLRSRAALIVVADGSGFSLRDTRQIQLAAQRGESLALLCRSPNELQLSSTATSRWKVTPLVDQDLFSALWKLELLRFRGSCPVPKEWLLSWVESDETSAFHLPAAAFRGITETIETTAIREDMPKEFIYEPRRSIRR